MKSILILATSMLLSVPVFAGANNENEVKTTTPVSAVNDVKTVQLTGSVMDHKNNETLVGATVYVDGKKYYSDLDGNFCISDIKPGKYQVKVEFISYKPAVVEVDVNKNEKVNIYLNQN